MKPVYKLVLLIYIMCNHKIPHPQKKKLQNTVIYHEISKFILRFHCILMVKATTAASLL